MADRVRKLARVLPRPFDSVLERSHGRYVGMRSRNLTRREGEPTERDARGLLVPPRRLRRLVSDTTTRRRGWIAARSMLR
jgi:hypothetical protein